MKPDQKLTPKYWVCHNTLEEDIHLDTADKYRRLCEDKAMRKFGDKRYHYHTNRGTFKISLIEVILVDS